MRVWLLPGGAPASARLPDGRRCERRAHRDRAAARGDLPPLRLRLPRLRAAPRCAGALWQRAARRGAADDLGAAGAGAARPERAWSACCSTCRSTSRRCSATRPSTVAFREKVVPLLRTYPFIAHLERRLLDGRGGLLAGDPAAGGGPARALAHLRDRHQRRRARARAQPASSRSTRMQRVHAELPCAPAASARSPSYYTARRTTARVFDPRSCERHRLRAAQPVTDRSFNEFHADRLPQRADLLRPHAAGRACTSSSTTAWRASACSAWATRSRSASPRFEDSLRGARRREKLYRRVADGVRARRDRRLVGRAARRSAHAARRRCRRSFELPIAIAQHRAPDVADDGLRDAARRRSALPVREADDKDALQPGHVYVAPPDYHLLVERGHFALSVDEPRAATRGPRSTSSSSRRPTRTASGVVGVC